jgi:hypothetical protein
VSFPGERERRGLTRAGSRSAVGARRFKSTISAEHRVPAKPAILASAGFVTFTEEDVASGYPPRRGVRR